MRRPGMMLIAAVAWVGVVVGHIAAYLLTYPSQGVRHVHLDITGHDWLGLGTASLLATIPVILLAAAMRGLRSDVSWAGPSLALRLLLVQAPAFSMIEIAERGWSLPETLLDPAVFVGLVLQPLLAVLATWILDLVQRAVHAIVVRLRARRRSVRPSVLPPDFERAFRSWLLIPSRRRAPPDELFV